MNDSKKKIILCGKEIEYTLRISGRSKKVRLAVYGDGRFVVTVPNRVDFDAVNRFVTQKSSWIVEKMEYFKNHPVKSVAKGDKADFLSKKAVALDLIKKKIAYFNGLYQFPFNGITVRNQKTRWGSCSRRGNLSFNYKIIMMSEKIADYIIVHELCHLKEFNHSEKFWNLVQRAIPNHKEIRKTLKRSDIF